MMFCGARSFSHADDDGGGGGSWASSSRSRPKPFKLKLKKKKSLGRSAKSANPFSASGLDKFEKLLAELEAEKKKVLLLKKGSDGDDTVRFRYRSNTEEWVPIVIKRPAQAPAPKKKKKKKKRKAAAEVEKLQLQEVEEAQLVVATNNGTRKLRRSCWDWISSSVPYCWAVVMVLVLLCMMFGRAFAVSWAAILWYMLPTMMKKCSNKNSTSTSIVAI